VKKGNSRTNVHEPVDYDDFRTGLDFRTVRQMLRVGSDDPRDWRYKRRHTVLGLWHQLKQQLYAEYLDRWDDQQLGGAQADQRAFRKAG